MSISAENRQECFPNRNRKEWRVADRWSRRRRKWRNRMRTTRSLIEIITAGRLSILRSLLAFLAENVSILIHYKFHSRVFIILRSPASRLFLLPLFSICVTCHCEAATASLWSFRLVQWRPKLSTTEPSTAKPKSIIGDERFQQTVQSKA